MSWAPKVVTELECCQQCAIIWWTQQQWNAIWDSQLNLQFQNSACRRILSTAADDDDDIYRKTMIFSSHQNQVEMRDCSRKNFSLWLEFISLACFPHYSNDIISSSSSTPRSFSLLLLFVFAFLLLQFVIHSMSRFLSQSRRLSTKLCCHHFTSFQPYLYILKVNITDDLHAYLQILTLFASFLILMIYFDQHFFLPNTKCNFHRFDSEWRAQNWISSSSCDAYGLRKHNLPVIKMIFSTLMSKIHKIHFVHNFFLFHSLRVWFFCVYSSAAVVVKLDIFRGISQHGYVPASRHAMSSLHLIRAILATCNGIMK